MSRIVVCRTAINKIGKKKQQQKVHRIYETKISFFEEMSIKLTNAYPNELRHREETQVNKCRNEKRRKK